MNTLDKIVSRARTATEADAREKANARFSPLIESLKRCDVICSLCRKPFAVSDETIVALKASGHIMCGPCIAQHEARP